MITRKKEKESQKKKNYLPSSDIESSPISCSTHKQDKKIERKKKSKEPKFHMTDQMKKHHLLEILEFRIHFDQDPNHGHPAQSVSILDELPDNKITDMNEEERSMKTNYQIINSIQIIPDFWPKRVYDDIPDIKSPKKNSKKISNQNQDNEFNDEDEDDKINDKYYDNNPNIIPVLKLSKEESQRLLQKITTASDDNIKQANKQKKTHHKNNKPNQKSYDKDGDFSNPEDEDDDELDRNEMRKLISLDVYSNRRSRSQFKTNKNRRGVVLTLPSLLYDTDESCDETDCELF